MFQHIHKNSLNKNAHFFDVCQYNFTHFDITYPRENVSMGMHHTDIERLNIFLARAITIHRDKYSDLLRIQDFYL